MAWRVLLVSEALEVWKIYSLADATPEPFSKGSPKCRQNINSAFMNYGEGGGAIGGGDSLRFAHD